jgi:uncharacterized LabA/DUF88 family protein
MQRAGRGARSLLKEFVPIHKRVCIFVDGENLRHSVSELFPTFDKREYLPKTNWGVFFDWIAQEAAGPDSSRIRTYWYAVQNIDFSPYNLNSTRSNPALLHDVLSKDAPRAKLLLATPQHEKSALLTKMADELQDVKESMEKRFNGWASIHDQIAHKNVSVEFRKAGSIRYNLFTRELGSEKAVDVKLATDPIRLKDIYDVAVIVSGDQDYVPAVDAIKDFGKHTVNVAFLTQGRRLLPGGARRLNQSTDWCLEVEYQDLKKYLNL